MGLRPFGRRCAVKMLWDAFAGLGGFPCLSRAGGRIAPHFDKSKCGAIRPLLSFLFAFGKPAVGSHHFLANDLLLKCGVIRPPDFGDFPCLSKVGGRIAYACTDIRMYVFMYACMYVYSYANFSVELSEAIDLGVPKHEAEKQCPRRAFLQQEDGCLGHFPKLCFESRIGHLAYSYICNEKSTDFLLYVGMYVRMYACVYVRMYVCMYVCTYVCM